jgi:hypothetical protein
MISSEFAPSQVEINSLGIGLLHYSNIEQLDLTDQEYLVVGEQYRTTNDTKDVKYSLIVNNDVVGVNTTRRRINALYDEGVKTSSFYVDNDIICNGNIIAKGLEFGNIKLDGVNSNILENLLTSINDINPLYYRGYGATKNKEGETSYQMSIDNIYTPSFITLGSKTDTYNNANPLNIVSATNYNANNVHISIQNKITNDEGESAKMRVGIIGDTPYSPAMFSTTTGMPLTFHVGLSTDEVNLLYSDGQGFPNYEINSNIKPSLTIDPKGNVAIGATESQEISYSKYVKVTNEIILKKDVTEFSKLTVKGHADIENIITYDYYTKSNLHIDDIYVRKLGLNFVATQIQPGDFLKGEFTFNSNVYIGKKDDKYTLEVNNILDVKGDLLVSNDTLLHNISVDDEAIFRNGAQFYDTVHMQDAVVGGDIMVNSGDLKIDNIRINISELHPIMVDAEIAEANNINGNNVLMLANSDFLNLSGGVNLAVPGRLGAGILKTDSYNEQFNVIKRNPTQYELMLQDASTSNIDVVMPTFYVGHLEGMDDIQYMKNRSLIINTNEVDALHNIYFYPGVNIIKNELNKYIPTLAVNQNNKVGVNTNDPQFSLDVIGEISCKDLYIKRNNGLGSEANKGLVFIHKPFKNAVFGDKSKDFYYINDQDNIDKFAINFANDTNIDMKGLNVKGGIHSVTDGFYENNVKLAGLKIIDKNTEKLAYINKHISIGHIVGSENSDNKPLSIRNISDNDFNDSILRFYRGKRTGAVNRNADFSGIDICNYETLLATEDKNLYKWFMYKSHYFDGDDTVGPLQFGYTDGTQHPKHFGMSMYFNKLNSNYSIDINNPNVDADFTNKNSAMSIYGNLDVHGNINIIGSNYYQVNGQQIAITPDAIERLYPNGSSSIYEDAMGSSETLNDVVITGKKVAVLPEETLVVGHLNAGFANYLNRLGKVSPSYSTPLTVYQNVENKPICSFMSSDNNQNDLNSASIDLSVFNLAENKGSISDSDYTGKKKNSIQMKVSNYGKIENDNLKSVFDLSSYDLKRKQYDKVMSIYHNGNTSYMNIGYNNTPHQQSTGTLNIVDLSNISLHVENSSKYLLQLTNMSMAPSINLHRRNADVDKFWTIKAPDDDNNFVLKYNQTNNSYIPDESTSKDVLVLSKDRFGFNVGKPECAFDIKGAHDEATVHITNKYSDVSSKEIYGKENILNTNLEYLTTFSFDNSSKSFYSSFKYFIQNSNMGVNDNYDKYIIYNYITDDVLVYDSNRITKSFDFDLEYDTTMSCNNIYMSFHQTKHTFNLREDGIYIKNDIESLPFLTLNDDFDISIIPSSISTSNFDIANVISHESSIYAYNYEMKHKVLTSYMSSYTCNITTDIYEDDDFMYTSNLIEIYLGDTGTYDGYIGNTQADYTMWPNNVKNHIFTSNIIYYDKYSSYDLDVNITKHATCSYVSDVYAPNVVMKDTTTNSFTSNRVKIGTFNEITIDSVTDFLNPDPLDNLNMWYETRDNVSNLTVNTHTYSEDFVILDKTFSFNVTLNDKYTVYNFSRPEFIQKYDFDISYTAVNSEEYQPHIIMQNNVDFIQTGEQKYGFVNKLYSRNGDIHIVSEDDVTSRHSLDISKSGDLKIYGNMNATEKNYGKLHVNTLILNGDVLDRLGNSMLFNYSEDMYNQAFIMQSSNYILYTSNYNIYSTSNINFTLQGTSQKGVTIEKEDTSGNSYDLFKINEANISRFTVTKGGNIGIKKDPDPGFDVDIKHKLRAEEVVTGFVRADGRYLENINIDQLKQGTVNTFIKNNSIAPQNALNQLQLDGNLYVTGNILVDGESVSLTTENQSSTSLVISGYTTEPSFVISRNDTINDFVNMSNIEKDNVFNIIKNGYVGIGVYPDENDDILLNVNGKIYSPDFDGAGSNLYGVNLSDRTTDLLKEGTHRLYYTAERVGNIAYASNIIALRETENTSNDVSKRVTTESIGHSNYILDTSNYVSGRMTTESIGHSNYILDTSNYVSGRMTTESIGHSNYILDTSNDVMKYFTESSNKLQSKIDNSIYFKREEVVTTRNIDISKIPNRINDENPLYTYRTVDISISYEDTFLFSAALIACYNDDIIVNVTHHIYYSYYTYDKIQDISTNGISFDENDFTFNGNMLEIKPKDDHYVISVITR